MESEKVKEIKKAIELCEFGKSCEDCHYCKLQECTHIKNIDTLTLINELESENEFLVGKIKEKNSESADYLLKVQQLKDRIAELEKKNERLLDSVETVQSNRCVYKCVLTKEHLTKFAERLKEKVVDKSENYVNQVVMATDIDETLKEFIDVDK